MSPKTLLRFAAFAMLPALSGFSARTAKELPARQVIQTMAKQEQNLLHSLLRFHPLVETYVQTMRPTRRLGMVPTGDHYYLGALELAPGLLEEQSYLHHGGCGSNPLKALHCLYSMHYNSSGFAAMLFPDPGRFNAANYHFRYVRQDFLGNVRCFVFNVRPRARLRGGFKGRIWIEARHDHLVRFNGIFTPQPFFGRYFHFDSWRVNVRPGLWVPAFVYSEETRVRDTSWFGLAGHTAFRAVTRLWGYGLGKLKRQSTASQMIIEGAVRDRARGQQAYSPIQAERIWQREAENNVLRKLQKAGMLAPPGPVDKLLATVVNNIEVTNNLDIEPAVRCRVLLTTPMVSFTVGHTIVLSRGMIDVLPNEPSLAMVLAHELATIVAGSPLNTKYAFYDRMLIPNSKVFDRFRLRQDPRDRAAVAAETLKLLENSPYKNQLGQAGLFLRMMRVRAKHLKHLMAPSFFGDALRHPSRQAGLEPLLRMAPPLQLTSLTQIAALPLGSRVLVNPWNDKAALFQAPPVALLDAREKMPFELTPQRPYLRRALARPQLAAAKTRATRVTP